MVVPEREAAQYVAQGVASCVVTPAWILRSAEKSVQVRCVAISPDVARQLASGAREDGRTHFGNYPAPPDADAGKAPSGACPACGLCEPHEASRGEVDDYALYFGDAGEEAPLQQLARVAESAAVAASALPLRVYLSARTPAGLIGEVPWGSCIVKGAVERSLAGEKACCATRSVTRGDFSVGFCRSVCSYSSLASSSLTFFLTVVSATAATSEARLRKTAAAFPAASAAPLQPYGAPPLVPATLLEGVAWSVTDPLETAERLGGGEEASQPVESALGGWVNTVVYRRAFLTLLFPLDRYQVSGKTGFLYLIRSFLAPPLGPEPHWFVTPTCMCTHLRLLVCSRAQESGPSSRTIYAGPKGLSAEAILQVRSSLVPAALPPPPARWGLFLRWCCFLPCLAGPALTFPAVSFAPAGDRLFLCGAAHPMRGATRHAYEVSSFFFFRAPNPSVLWPLAARSIRPVLFYKCYKL